MDGKTTKTESKTKTRKTAEEEQEGGAQQQSNHDLSGEEADDSSCDIDRYDDIGRRVLIDDYVMANRPVLFRTVNGQSVTAGWSNWTEIYEKRWDVEIATRPSSFDASSLTK